MALEDITKLGKALAKTQFAFIPRGEHTLKNIYRLVSTEYPHLCDDNYSCADNCAGGGGQPEWKHAVRRALDDQKAKGGFVASGSKRGHWRFMRTAEKLSRRTKQIQAPTGVDHQRVCLKCGGDDFEVSISSSTGKRRFYCRSCRTARRLKNRGTLGRKCSKCGGDDFGESISSSTGKRQLYCRTCQAERRLTYNMRLKASGGSHTRKQFLEKLKTILECPRCGRAWKDIPPRPNKRYRTVWTEDHIIPLSKEGSDDISNIQPLCYQCQFHKNAGT